MTARPPHIAQAPHITQAPHIARAPHTTRATHIVGIDVGGAHLKYVDQTSTAVSKFFPMWTDKDRLAEKLTTDLRSHFGGATEIAVTMTGELADCFFDREEGVRFIVDAATMATEDCGIARPLFYQVDGSFVVSGQAKDNVDLVAASNWHASARWIAENSLALNAQASPKTKHLVVDIGSTTTDLIPIMDGKVATNSQTDFDRLAEGSLVYVGCGRTPLCALVDQVRFGDRNVGVMNEVFATTDDVWLLLERCEPDEADCHTADGRPRTIGMAANRIARMIGLDHRDVSTAEARMIASQVSEKFEMRIRDAIAKVDQGGDVFVIGHGGSDTAWLAAMFGDRRFHVIANSLGDKIARSFPAFAVCKLLQERMRGERAIKVSDRATSCDSATPSDSAASGDRAIP